MGMDDDLRDLSRDRDMEQVRENHRVMRTVVEAHIAWLRSLDLSPVLCERCIRDYHASVFCAQTIFEYVRHPE